jgi:hypothetical protein
MRNSVLILILFLMLKHEKLCFNNKKSSVKPIRFYTRLAMLFVLFLHVIGTTYVLTCLLNLYVSARLRFSVMSSYGGYPLATLRPRCGGSSLLAGPPARFGDKRAASAFLVTLLVFRAIPFVKYRHGDSSQFRLRCRSELILQTLSLHLFLDL